MKYHSWKLLTKHSLLLSWVLTIILSSITFFALIFITFLIKLCHHFITFSNLFFTQCPITNFTVPDDVALFATVIQFRCSFLAVEPCANRSNQEGDHNNELPNHSTVICVLINYIRWRRLTEGLIKQMEN